MDAFISIQCPIYKDIFQNTLLANTKCTPGILVPKISSTTHLVQRAIQRWLLHPNGISSITCVHFPYSYASSKQVSEKVSKPFSGSIFHFIQLSTVKNPIFSKMLLFPAKKQETNYFLRFFAKNESKFFVSGVESYLTNKFIPLVKQYGYLTN